LSVKDETKDILRRAREDYKQTAETLFLVEYHL